MSPNRFDRDREGVPREIDPDDISQRIAAHLEPFFEQRAKETERFDSFDKTLKRLHLWIIMGGIFVGGGFVAGVRLQSYAKNEDLAAVLNRITILETKANGTDERIQEILRILRRNGTP